MPQEVPDKALASALKVAKKKALNFGVVLKGTKVLKLIVNRKPIKDKEMQDAKSEHKGTDYYIGVCQGSGGQEIAFRIVGNWPEIKAMQFKELISEQTGLTVKPVFETVNELVEIDDNDDSDDDSDDQGGTPQQATAGANEAQGSNEGTQPDPKAAQWQNVWSDLEPRYLAALKTAPDDLASKMKVVHAYANEQAEAGQFDKALAAVARLEPLLQLAAGGKGPAGEVAAGTVEKRKYVLERFRELPKEIKPKVDALKAAIAREVPEEDANELCQQIEESLGFLYEELRDEIDAAIIAGDMKMIAGLRSRVFSDDLVAHLGKTPLIQGSEFAKVIVEALDEIEAKLAG